MEGEEYVHTPVMAEEVLSALGPRKAGGVVVDATVGEGGHSALFLERFPDVTVIGVDADKSILERARRRLEKPFGERIRLYNAWAQDFFSSYPEDLKRPDSVLIDLGVSLYHYERGGRGFSFRRDEPLDMRIDTGGGITAAGLIAGLPERDLANLLYANAEERYSRRIARGIACARKGGNIPGSAALAAIVEASVPGAYRHGPAHPATKTFQALRIEVNGELTRLRSLLEGAFRVLEPGGRLGVITFHSLEDRIVKRFFREKSVPSISGSETPIDKTGGEAEPLTKKGAVPSAEEIRRNPPSRSARFRALEKKG